MRTSAWVGSLSCSKIQPADTDL